MFDPNNNEAKALFNKLDKIVRDNSSDEGQTVDWNAFEVQAREAIREYIIKMGLYTTSTSVKHTVDKFMRGWKQDYIELMAKPEVQREIAMLSCEGLDMNEFIPECLALFEVKKVLPIELYEVLNKKKVDKAGHEIIKKFLEENPKFIVDTVIDYDLVDEYNEIVKMIEKV